MSRPAITKAHWGGHKPPLQCCPWAPRPPPGGGGRAGPWTSLIAKMWLVFLSNVIVRGCKIDLGLENTNGSNIPSRLIHTPEIVSFMSFSFWHPNPGHRTVIRTPSESCATIISVPQMHRQAVTDAILPKSGRALHSHVVWGCYAQRSRAASHYIGRRDRNNRMIAWAIKPNPIRTPMTARPTNTSSMLSLRSN